MVDADLGKLLQFFKALAEENRLKILGILANREASVEELAALLKLKAPTISHHLAKLKEIELVGMRPEGNSHIYWLRSEALLELTKSLLTTERMATWTNDLESEAWEKKVLRDFFEGETLKEIPASRKKREVVLRWLATRFEAGLKYPEKSVNEIIKRHHPDFATLRRELVGQGLMQREEGIYWRI